MKNVHKARVLGYTGGLLPKEDRVNLIEYTDDSVRFFDYQGKKHKVRLYKDTKLGISYFKYRGGTYYIEYHSAKGVGSHYKVYRRNGNIMMDEFGTNLPLSYEALRFKHFI